ncbi:MAG TPA: hypothetical protein VFN23_13320 [Ktedonobacteraceae bacterium]|nr:hypothetical protein [Ktedonobacteraceae bacterium]
MAKDQFERRTYRKSPGRQYGYEYNPLNEQNNKQKLEMKRLESSGSLEDWSSRRDNSRISRQSAPLAPRPDLRRTRQLMRKSILNSKSNGSHSSSLNEGVEDELDFYDMPQNEPDLYEDEEDSTLFSNRYPTRGQRALQTYAPPRRYQDMTEEVLDEQWVPQEMVYAESEYDDDTEDYEDPLEHRLNRIESRLSQSLNQDAAMSVRRPSRRPYTEIEPEYEDEGYEDSAYDVPIERERREKRGISRRKFLWGAGAAAIVGTGIAAAELGPKVPQALSTASSNVEHQIQQAFNDGLAKGAEEARKELLNSLDSIEGVSLDAAIGAAKLTRAAYDVFVSPVVTLAATITGDFLDVTLRAYKTARGWLRNIGQDNSTMGALQTVLETWLKQVQDMPKELQKITDTDLDGAQSYLNALKQKIKQEQAALNNPNQQASPTPAATKKPTK